MILEILSLFLISLGCLVMFSATLALLRFSNIYMRLHASGKASTGVTLALLSGVLLRTRISSTSGKIILIILAIIITGPILSHAIARAAHLSSGLTAEVPFQDLSMEEKTEDEESEVKDDN